MKQEDLSKVYDRSIWERHFENFLPDSYKPDTRRIDFSESGYQYFEEGRFFGTLNEGRETLLVMELSATKSIDLGKMLQMELIASI